MEQIHELLEKLAEAVKAEFPEMTKAMFVVDTEDGYRDITVSQVEKDMSLPVSAWKRRDLWDQHTFGDGWSEDRSADQNQYYKETKCLLEV